VTEKTSLEEKTSLSTQCTGSLSWSSPPPTGSDTSNGPTTGMDITTEPRPSHDINLDMLIRVRKQSDYQHRVTFCATCAANASSYRISFPFTENVVGADAEAGHLERIAVVDLQVLDDGLSFELDTPPRSRHAYEI
jgi:hypothetical protein